MMMISGLCLQTSKPHPVHIIVYWYMHRNPVLLNNHKLQFHWGNALNFSPEADVMWYPSFPLNAEPPQISRALVPNTVTKENEEVILTCIARGYPAPTISWEHEGMTVTRDNPSFEINSTTSQDGFTELVTSYLKMVSANSSVDGKFECIANPPLSDNVGGRILNSVSTSTQLSILGKAVNISSRRVFNSGLT